MTHEKTHYLALCREQLTPREIGAFNRRVVLAMLRNCPGITAREISVRTGIGVCAIGRHISSIRADWLKEQS